MAVAVWATMLYGLLAAVGGILGYVKAGSKVSLISGVVSGVLLLGLGVLQLQGIPWATPSALALVLGLVGVFCARLVKTGKWMPAGLMVATGVAAAVVLAIEL